MLYNTTVYFQDTFYTQSYYFVYLADFTFEIAKENDIIKDREYEH